MLNKHQKISVGGSLITFALIFVTILILVQTAGTVSLFSEFMFLTGGIMLGLGTTLAVSGLADQKKSDVL